MTHHQIKRNRVSRAHPIPYTLTREAVMGRIPDVLWERLTAAEIAVVLTVVEAAYQDGRAAAERDILEEGCIWDPAAKRLIDLTS